MPRRILLVDDDLSIAKITKLYLTKNGYEVEEAFDGQDALEKIKAGHFQLIVLDLMLPRLDGWAVCKQLREAGDFTPVVMLTARSEVHDRIEGLQIGADDYMVKPFDPNELLARIDALLRREERHQSRREAEGERENAKGGDREGGKLLSVGNLQLKLDAFTVSINKESVSLTRREFDLLAWLAAHPERVYTREDLIAQIWGWDYEGEDRVVDLYIQRIRRKLGAGQGWQLTTIWGVGYKFEVGSE